MIPFLCQPVNSKIIRTENKSDWPGAFAKRGGEDEGTNWLQITFCYYRNILYVSWSWQWLHHICQNPQIFFLKKVNFTVCKSYLTKWREQDINVLLCYLKYIALHLNLIIEEKLKESPNSVLLFYMTDLSYYKRSFEN